MRYFVVLGAWKRTKRSYTIRNAKWDKQKTNGNNLGVLRQTYFYALCKLNFYKRRLLEDEKFLENIFCIWNNQQRLITYAETFERRIRLFINRHAAWKPDVYACMRERTKFLTPPPSSSDPSSQPFKALSAITMGCTTTNDTSGDIHLMLYSSRVSVWKFLSLRKRGKYVASRSVYFLRRY